MNPIWRDRLLTSKILDALQIAPVVFINGPRQAGKSTLVQNLRLDDHPPEYISFDKPAYIIAATQAPQEFLRPREHTLVIDEVQLVPEIFRALKVAVDDLRLQNAAKANGRFILTGSANIMVLPKLSDALVGRMSVITLYPFAMAEIVSGKGNCIDRIFSKDFSHLTNGDITLEEAIRLATFPEISGKNGAAQNIWFDGYTTTILQRDVRMLLELSKITLLPSLLRILAARAGSLINDADIARDIGLNPITAKTYRKALQAMFLSFDVTSWYKNITKRLVKSSKGYLIDTLLLCHALGYEVEDLQLKNSILFGHVVENFVAVELTKLITFCRLHTQLHHFRTSDGKEIDFVLERKDGTLAGVEVKSSETIEVKDFRGLQELQKHARNNFACGVVLYKGKEVVPCGENLWAVPYHLLWQ